MLGPSTIPALNSNEKQTLVALAKDALTGLYDQNYSSILLSFGRKVDLLTGALIEPYPCFVTLTTSRGRLRGCVGAMTSSQLLYKNVFYYTRAAALDDPRFRSVEATEIPDLKIHISVLGPMEPLATLADLRVGEHGLYVKYGNRHGVLLADVATERNWGPEEFLEQTCVKAGLPPEDADNYEVFRFSQISFGEEA